MIRPGIAAVRKIVADKVGVIEGVTVTPIISDDIKEGDWYIAGRNTGPHLFTCKKNDREKGWIVPEENGYLFDTGECVKVLVTFD